MNCLQERITVGQTHSIVVCFGFSYIYYFSIASVWNIFNMEVQYHSPPLEPGPSKNVLNYRGRWNSEFYVSEDSAWIYVAMQNTFIKIDLAGTPTSKFRLGILFGHRISGREKAHSRCYIEILRLLLSAGYVSQSSHFSVKLLDNCPSSQVSVVWTFLWSRGRKV